MRYRRYMWIVDFVGVLAAISIFGYLFFPAEWRPAGRVDDFWGNASAELAGIWISVRLIEWALRQHDLSARVRVRTVRNMRMLENQLMHFLDSRFVGALRRLDFEIGWVRNRGDARKRWLKKDEIQDLELFFSALADVRAMLPSMEDYSSNEGKTDEIVRSNEFGEKLVALASARERAEVNILQETDEDEGIVG
ncbi:hypothetical protein GEU84_017050 [Fertoebacter nigrum]|uniref:Uncharacterized protein n=1 Tax=Fertoeibacter niger TaxID=2656921 RepID=A0A8X8H2U1_9RHOB|nr:hypothetical protein [Fertoeibacter niger]NUB46105.1 hypothetical protein [Fertoeibacter niger]